MTSVTGSEVFDHGVAEKSFADPHIIAGLDARDQHCIAGRIIILGNDGIATRISVARANLNVQDYCPNT